MNTAFLRLDGPLQSWGVTSRFVYRDTADGPSFSGIVGLICAAMGLRRAEANARLPELAKLEMGVRVDRPGWKMSDYHTAGAGVGMMSAAGDIKKTATTGEFETHVMRKEYLADASFLVALRGEPTTIDQVAAALQDPVWPPFLGRKSCPPSVPIYEGGGEFETVEAALRSRTWQPRLDGFEKVPRSLRAFVPAAIGEGFAVADVPVSFTHRVYHTRNVREIDIPVTLGAALYEDVPKPRRDQPTKLPGWKDRRGVRLREDRHLCVFCKEPARDVHHVSYANAGHEPPADLRSVCRLCHDAMTLLEYAAGLGTERIDPSCPANRERILAQRKSILNHRDPDRRHRQLREEDD